METTINDIFKTAAKYFLKDFKRKGGSQKKVAQELGITPSYVSSVINGSRTASLTLFEQIAFMISGKPLDEFLWVGRRLINGLSPILEKEKELYDTPEELISKLTYYLVDHQRMQKALKDEQWLFQEAINRADYGIVIASSERKVLACNAAYQRLFGYPDEIIATRDMSVYVRYGRNQMANLEKFDKDIQEAFASRVPISHIVELKDGRLIKRDVFPLHRGTKLAGRLAHLTDISSTKSKPTRNNS